MNRKAFYDALRPPLGALTQANVVGFELFLNEAERRRVGLFTLANILAQVWWETGKTMSPVEEAFYLGARAPAYRRKLRYYPFHGRGHIQNTHRINYEKLSDLWFEMTGEHVDFVKNPELLLTNKYSVPLTFEGFSRGIWTGKDAADYIDEIDESDEEDAREYREARRIVNGTDKAGEIARLSLTFERALKAADYGGVPPSPLPPDREPIEPEPEKHWLARLLEAFLSLFKRS